MLNDVQVCMSGRGCDSYVPLAGQATQALIDLGAGPIDAVLAGLLIVLIAVAALALLLRARRRWSDASALLVAGGLLAAVPPLLPAVAPVGEVFVLGSSACIGVGLVALARRLPRLLGAVLVVVGGLRLLELPITAVQYALAAPVGSAPELVLQRLDGLALVVAALALLLARERLGALRWALLMPIVASFVTGIRLVTPFAAPWWIDLLPAVAMIAVGLLVQPGAPIGPPVRRWSVLAATAVVASAIVTVFGLLLAPFVPWSRTPAAADPPPIGPVRVVTASTRVVLPLDEFVQVTTDRSAVLAAENGLIRACAEREGVAVHVADLLPAETAWTGRAQLGLIDADRAAAVGYWSPHPAEPESGAPTDHDLRVLSACVGDARTELGDDGAPQLVVDRGAADADERMEADPRVRRLDGAWSRCMLLRGFPAPSPFVLGQGQDAGDDGAATFPTPDETRAASADIACEAQTGLPGLRAAVLAAYEQRFIATHASDLAAVRAELATELRLARTVRPSVG